MIIHCDLYSFDYCRYRNIYTHSDTNHFDFHFLSYFKRLGPNYPSNMSSMSDVINVQKRIREFCDPLSYSFEFPVRCLDTRINDVGDNNFPTRSILGKLVFWIYISVTYTGESPS